MSKILDMAKDFEQRSKQQASDTEAHLKNEFERHEKFIAQALRSSEQKIKSDISAQNQRMSALILKGWLWIVLSVLMALAACMSVIWWQGEIILANQQEISRQSTTIERLEKSGGKIQFSNCDKRLCAQIDENAPNYQDGYRILKGY